MEILEITSLNNRYLKMYSRLLDSKKYREKMSMVSIEGKRIIQDCFDNCIKIFYIFVDEDKVYKYNDIISFLKKTGIPVYLLKNNLSQKISQTSNSQGIFAIVEKSFKFDFESSIKKGQKFLILENIKDPYNMGTIIRTSKAFGFDNIVLNSGCVDPFSPKVIRGSMGNVFKVNILEVESSFMFLKNIYKYGYDVVSTCLCGDSYKLNGFCFKDKLAIVFGNEAYGITDEVLQISTHKLFIPMDKSVESLNVAVAASIVMWEVFKTF